jgi:hypothetical protein
MGYYQFADASPSVDDFPDNLGNVMDEEGDTYEEIRLRNPSPCASWHGGWVPGNAPCQPHRRWWPRL